MGIQKPEEIDPNEGRGLKETITAAGDFSFDIELGEDGPYNIRLEATDGAGNTIIIENQTTLDTKPPGFEGIMPRTGARIYETYAKEVDIEGRTKPFTKVKIYLNEIGDVEDFSTISDSTGLFRLEDVDITSYFRGSLIPEHVGVGELESRYGVVEEEAGSPDSTLRKVKRGCLEKELGQRDALDRRIAKSGCQSQIEVLGVDDRHLFMRYHRAHRKEDYGQMVVARRDDGAYWLDQLTVIHGPQSAIESAAHYAPYDW